MWIAKMENGHPSDSFVATCITVTEYYGFTYSDGCLHP